MKAPRVQLGEIAKPKQWKTLSKKQMSAEGYPVYGANGRIGFSEAFTHEDPVILVGCRGSCGSVHVTEPKSYANGNAMALDQLDQSRVAIGFLEKFLKYRGFRDVISGTSQPQIIRANIVKIEIPLPPLAEQNRLAGILEATDALRAKRRESLAELDTLLQSTFLEMFGDPVTNPKGWEKPILESFCRPRQWPTIKKTQLLDAGYPVFGANGRIGFYSDYNHAEATVLITCRGATCGTINLCEPMSYVTGNAMALDDLDRGRIETRFLDHALANTDFSGVITGVAQPQITRQSLKQLSVPVPPIDLQRRFVAIVECVEQHRSSQRAHLTELDTLFTSLQSRAFRGEL